MGRWLNQPFCIHVKIFTPIVCVSFWLLFLEYRCIVCTQIFVFMQDDRTHWAEIVHQPLLVKNNIPPPVWQASYSPDLALYEFWLFPNLKITWFPCGVASATPPAPWRWIFSTCIKMKCTDSLLNPSSACGWPAWACFTLDWDTALFKVGVPFLDLNFIHHCQKSAGSGWFEL